MTRVFPRNFIVVLLFLIVCTACKDKSNKVYQESDIQIIPKVNQLALTSGTFRFDENTSFVVSEKGQEIAARLLKDKFQVASNWELQIVTEAPQSNYVLFQVVDSLENEAYNLNVSTSHITIEASDNSGFLYGIQSLRQLLPVEIESKTPVENLNWEIPCLEIMDGPRFKWRGLMLDLSRHFFDKEYIKETIDALSLHKMNILHLHLVDDQGWRIEIKKYPKLTQIGAWRVDQEHLPWNDRTTNSPEEKGTYGGFLTQEDIKEIVAYATLKGVEVVPEIEMPAHVSSAIAAYPGLSCHERPIAVPSGALWPITDIYCAGKESTFEFLENVLLEVMELFPSKYIHIGGDEATKTNWETCPHCKKRIVAEGLDNVEELQSYFIKRMERFINSKGKKLIGWDEILEGGLAPEATVMSWRGVKGGVEAAKHGNDAIMTPVGYCYFDYYQGPPEYEPAAGGSVTTVSKVYQFDPIVETLTEEETKRVLGGQANVWAEHIPTEDHSQYMIFPRLTALSETLWSPKDSRNWEDFSGRLKRMFERYRLLDINYAKSAYLITSDVKTAIESKSISLSLHNEFPDSDIRFALDNEVLDSGSTKFTEPITITKTTAVKAALFEGDDPVGRVFEDTIKFHKGVAGKVTYLTDYDKRYQGSGAFNSVNTLRGTKNFRDGRWQAWLNENAEMTIALGNGENIGQVVVGSMVNQKNGIYYPTEIEVSVSVDGKVFTQVGKVENPYEVDNRAALKDFVVNFEEQEVNYVKVKASFAEKDSDLDEVWLFIDEVLVN